ncbi:MAG: RidA family protein [Propionibacteriaceae bacterium]|nr:RidA family protein [Propionibacteriaceae bacterium]
MHVTSALVTASAPAAIGPYSQGVDTGELVFCSGQLPIDPTTGELDGATASEQTARSISNLQAVLAAAGLSLADVIKTTVYLTDITDFATMNEIYAEWFTGDVLPARSAIQVAGLPRGSLVEIEAIAQRKTDANRRAADSQPQTTQRSATLPRAMRSRRVNGREIPLLAGGEQPLT